MSFFRHQLIADGEGILALDLNNISQWLRCEVLNTLGPMAQVDPVETLPNFNHLFCVGNGGAPFPGTGLQLNSKAGIIAQSLGPVFNTGPSFIPYALAANDLQTTFAAADPTNPRIDLICVFLGEADGTPDLRHFEDATTGAKSTDPIAATSRGATINKVVVVGTPGATPGIPNVPVASVPWAAVYIPAAATTILPENIYDYRVPVGGAGYVDVPGKDFSCVANLSLKDDSFIDNTPGVVLGFAGTFNCKFPARPNQRIMQISLTSQNAVSADIRQGEETFRWNTPGLLMTRDLSATLTPAGGLFKRTFTPGVAPAALDPPIWGSGQANWYAVASTPTFGILRVAFSATVDCFLAGARFLVAGA